MRKIQLPFWEVSWDEKDPKKKHKQANKWMNECKQQQQQQQQDNVYLLWTFDCEAITGNSRLNHTSIQHPRRPSFIWLALNALRLVVWRNFELSEGICNFPKGQIIQITKGSLPSLPLCYHNWCPKEIIWNQLIRLEH